MACGVLSGMITMRTAVLFLIGATACTTDAAGPLPPAFSHTRATRACGPADGPAVAIYLAGAPVTTVEPPVPYVRVAIWEGITSITRQDWPLADTSSLGTAWHFTGAGFETVTSGQLHIDAVNADSSIDGTVVLDFPAAGRIEGRFHATWLSRAPNCM